MTRWAAGVTISLLTACMGAPSTGFGQNVVRYDSFDFKILQTEHFDIYYYDEEREAVVKPAAWRSVGMHGYRGC